MQKETSRVLRLNAVKELTGLSRSTIYAFIKIGAFPKPIKLGRRAVAWLEADLQEWIIDRTKASR